MQKNIIERIKKQYASKVYNLFKIIQKKADLLKVNVFLVGGMVRDTVLNISNIDLDIAVEGMKAFDFALAVGKESGWNIKSYPEFKTSKAETKDGLKIDFATCRKEIYPDSGSLPVVKETDLKNDLYRRDFTINALAVSLNKSSFGEVLDFFGGMRDLEKKYIRILHKNSFKDDPTRILRGIKFAGRLGFNFSKDTENAMSDAVREKVLDNISFDRISRELKLIFKEQKIYDILYLLDKYAGLDFIDGSITLNSQKKELFKKTGYIFSRLKEKTLLDGFEVWILSFLVLLDKTNFVESKKICEKFNFTNEEKYKILSYKEKEKHLPEFLKQAKTNPASTIYKFFNDLSLEGAVYILAKEKNNDIKNKITHFLVKDRNISIEVTGEDLKQIGIKPGPEYGKILSETLYAKIDGKINGCEEEKQFIMKYKNKL